jgi:hypothetical protein
LKTGAKVLYQDGGKMSKLTAAARKAIPTSKFAGPGRTFPIPDRNHAEAAIRDAPKSVRAGNLTPSSAARIRARASAMLKGGK